MLTIDATGLIAGRLATFVAKKLLEGETIEIINSEKAVVTGKKKDVLTKFKQKVARGDPHHGPYYPKSAERILRRIIRGMLPFRQARGREAYLAINAKAATIAKPPSLIHLTRLF